MQLANPFIRLPLMFDAARLATEIAQFGADDWRPHPQGHPGNTALPLIARNGSPLDDSTYGPMQPTQHLARCPYIRQVMASLHATLGRSRLMRLDARAEATPHVDVNYYWLQRVRVHIPVVTFPEVRFLCGKATTYMGPGECWIFDNWRVHNVLNPTPHERTHLVIDTVGSGAFWQMTEHEDAPVRMVPFDPNANPELSFESVNAPGVMSPWEVNEIWGDWLADAYAGNSDGDTIEAMKTAVLPVMRDWRNAWARYGASNDGAAEYKRVLLRLRETLVPLQEKVILPNGADLAMQVVKQLIPVMFNAELLSPARHRDERMPLRA
jgi:Aspartyl/Asparaginyl beta-hydroxylase